MFFVMQNDILLQKNHFHEIWFFYFLFTELITTELQMQCFKIAMFQNCNVSKLQCFKLQKQWMNASNCKSNECFKLQMQCFKWHSYNLVIFHNFNISLKTLIDTWKKQHFLQKSHIKGPSKQCKMTFYCKKIIFMKIGFQKKKKKKKNFIL